MEQLQQTERSLKRYLKRKIAYSVALLVSFLIGGNLSNAFGAIAVGEPPPGGTSATPGSSAVTPFGEGNVGSPTRKNILITSSTDELLSRIQAQKSEIEALLAENEARLRELDRGLYELVRAADYYAKPVYSSHQVFLNYLWNDEGTGKDNTKSEWKETLDALALERPASSVASPYVAGTTVGSEAELLGLIKGYGPDGQKTAAGTNGVVSLEEGQTIELDLGVNITPHDPDIPQISKSVSANVAAPTITAPTFNANIPAAPSAPVPPSVSVNVNVTAPAATANIAITPPVAPSPQVPADKTIAITVPAMPAPFEPRIIEPPTQPAAPTITTPTVFTPPTLPFVGQGFAQGAVVSRPQTNIIIQNYETYTTSAPITITTGTGGTTWSGGNITMTTAVTSGYNAEGPGTYTLTPGSTASVLNAFINELRDHNATIGGNYDMTYASGTGSKIFLSHNPAGVSGLTSSDYDGYNQTGEKRAKLTGTLTLHGLTTASPGVGDVLIGVEHQLWDRRVNVGSWSAFENTGTITLASGKQVIGIQIDVEAYDTIRTTNNKTINSGKIIINSTESVGIDFGNYNSFVLQDDVTIGDIEVNGSHNYGVRMKNLKDGAIATYDYYDDVTMTGGTGKKILVGGTENVGMGVGKSVSSTPATAALHLPAEVTGANPISNFYGINIEIIGNKVVGFMRLADYSTNNTNDFLLNSQTMGTFDIGTGATNSTLIRTDYRGIQILKNITTTGTTGTGNTVAHANGAAQYIINGATITVNTGLKNTTGLAATSSTASSINNIRNTGTIDIKDEGGIGMYVDANSRGISSGTITVTGAKNNAGVANNGIFTLSGTINAEGQKSSGIYNHNNFTINGVTTINTKKGATAIYADAGTLTSSAGANLKINVDDSTSPVDKGVAVYATGATTLVDIQGAEIKVLDGSAGLASYSGSTIKFNNGDIEYDGDGYAVYSDGTGHIDLTGATVKLLGNAVGLQLDMAVSPPAVTLSGTTINVQSLNAIGVNILNQTADVMELDPGDTQVSQLNAALMTALGGVTFTGVAGYTQAAVENGTLNINTPLDKATNAGPSGFYYRNFLAQALKLNVKADITANLSSADATADFNGQVSALEMSASKLASGLSQTQINVTGGVKVVANRTDSGAGAIGAFINYGELTNDGLIEVEKTGLNQGGVGVVAVDGSHAANNQDIEVYGNKGIGIFAAAYRRMSGGTLAGQEFGGLAGEGATEVVNNGTITAFGQNGTGIYLWNNSAETALLPSGTPTTTVKVDNAAGGIINAKADNSAGIYAVGNGTLAQTTVANNGTIEVGKNGIGIFAENFVDVTKAGTLKLGEEAIGIILDKTSVLSDTSLITAQATTTAGNKMVVALRSTTGSNDPAAQTLNLNIDTSALDKGTAIYVWNRGAAATTISSTGNITTGTDGVGIYTENGHSTNDGTITLAATGDRAVGMYTKNGGIVNGAGGVINVNKQGQIGMAATSASGGIINNGTINLNAGQATGVLVTAGASVTDASAGNVIFGAGASNSFGIASDAGNVTISGGVYTLDNSGNNIYVYGKNNSAILVGGPLTIDGVTAGTGKSVGIYLDGTNTLVSTSTLTATNGSVGVYTKGNNTLTNGTYAADGDQSVGIYLENGGTLQNLTVSADAAAGKNVVGIYGNGGVINVGTGLTLQLAPTGTTGTGVYLANGSTITGAPVTVINSGSVTNAGIYYTGTGTAAQGTDLLISGNKVVGIFADGGVKVTNAKAITYGGSDNVGAFIAGNSEYTSTSATDSVTTAGSVGIYAADGKGIQNGTLTVANGTSAALAAKADTAGKTATIENTGTVNAAAGVGMLLGDIGTAPAGTSRGTNSGTIDVTAGGATGVVVGLGDTKFDGTGGVIRVAGTAGTSAAGMYLDGTGAGQVTATGTIQLVNADAVGVFADNGALVDFPLQLSGTAGIGLFADNGVVISGTVDASGTTDTIALYLRGASGNTVTFNNATIKTGSASSSAAMGILASGLGSWTLQTVSVEATGTDAVGVLATNGTNLDYKATITAQNGALGIYADNTSTLDANGGILNIGANAIGAYIDGGTANIGTLGTVQLNFTGTNGVGIYSANGATTTLGGNIAVTGSGTLSAVENGSQTTTGNLTVENGNIGLLGQYDAAGVPYSPVYNLTNSGTLLVKTAAIGIAAIAKVGGTPPAAGDVRVVNSGSIQVQDAGSVGIYSDMADIDNGAGSISVGENGIGLYAKNNAAITDFGNIQVTKGTGAVLDGVTGISSTGVITVNSGDASHYSVGAFYRNVATISAIPTVNLAGNYAVALIVEGTGSVAYTNPITVGSAASAFHDQIFLKVQGDTTAGTPITVTAGTVDVYGDQNIGIFADTAVLTTGNVHVYPSTASADKSKSSIGIYGNNAAITAGNVDAEKNAVGIFGTAVRTGITAGNVQAAEGAVGIYAEGSGNHTENVSLTGTLNVDDGKALGIYGKDLDISISTPVTLGEKGSVGIVSEGTGDVTLSANVNVAGVTTQNNQDGAILLYKKGDTGTITTSGNWTIGTEGYGIYVEQSGAGTVTVQNSATINLDESAVAAYVNGNVTLKNTGTITTGATNFNGDPENAAQHLNSVGIYLKGGATGENAVGGVINVLHSHSVGVYGVGAGTSFTNNGIINVDNGATGILLKTHATAVNKGTINILSDAAGAADKVSVAMAAYDGSEIANEGTINLGAGTGMYVGITARAVNRAGGVINLTDGIGITGDGDLVNLGTINVSGVGKDVEQGKNTEVEKGAVRIDKDGNVYLNGNYVGVGGTIIAKNNVILDGAYVGLEQFTQTDIPVVTTEGVISGDVRLLPNFTTMGNGIHWVIENFTDYFNTPGAASKIKIQTSPLFLTKAAGNDLVLYKRPYSDMVVGNQYKNLYDGLDSLFSEDGSKNNTPEFQMLTSWHEYLETVNNAYGETAYDKAFSAGMSELRGDVYSTVRKRMQSVQGAFDNAWEELESAYNITKNSNKYSVIHTRGKYSDKTTGIDGYDYSVQGLLYMKEFEGRNYGNKWGWYTGFAVGDFEFDDNHQYGKHSDERVYGVRLGFHGVKSFGDGDTLRLVTRLEGAYNRHETKRILELEKPYENKGKYDSYGVKLDTRLEKTLTRGYKHNVTAYAGVNASWNRVRKFDEKGDGLELTVKGQEYTSVEVNAGIKGSYRAYVGKKVDVKLTGDLGYARELNEKGYKRMQARISDGTADFYELIRPEKERGSFRAKAGLTIEKANKVGVTFSVEGRKYDNKDKMDVRFGVGFKYVFGL
jgi:hypothetical protein